ncbi:MAG: hypothetical protein ACPGR8_15110 [Limisphaerales bacterium]
MKRTATPDPEDVPGESGVPDTPGPPEQDASTAPPAGPVQGVPASRIPKKDVLCLMPMIDGAYATAVCYDGSVVLLEPPGGENVVLIGLKHSLEMVVPVAGQTGHQFAIGRLCTGQFSHEAATPGPYFLVVVAPGSDTLTFWGGEDFQTQILPPVRLEGVIQQVVAGSDGLVAAISGESRRASCVILQPGVSQEDSLRQLEGPVGTVRLALDRYGSRIDAITARPQLLVSGEPTRFYVLPGIRAEWHAEGTSLAPGLGTGRETKVVNVVGTHSIAGVDIVVPEANPYWTEITFNFGTQKLVLPRPSLTTLWLGSNPYLVVGAPDFGDGSIEPEVVPICRGSMTSDASIFPRETRLINRIDPASFPTIGAEDILLTGGQIYKLGRM